MYSKLDDGCFQHAPVAVACGCSHNPFTSTYFILILIISGCWQNAYDNFRLFTIFAWWFWL